MAALAESLAASVRLQQELAAQSPHVLQLLSDLQQDERSFFVEHEPADPFPARLFDTEAPVASDEELLRWAAALLDVLRVLGAYDPNRPTVHGGLSGGAILASPEGIAKVTDFGFAPSLCGALGVDGFLNLAVGPGAEHLPEYRETGVWEVLPPDEFERDDRLCGFIDPEKYGNPATLKTFEPGSDIIAAGFLLHLLAEHHHPYLEGTEDHRVVAIAESMAWQVYNGARRKSLRESSDPKIQTWCALVARMLARLPKDRPSAAEAARELADVGIKPVDRSGILEAQLDVLPGLAADGKWEQLQRRARAISANDAATPEIVERVDAFLREADVNVRLAEASDLLTTDRWAEVRRDLEQLPDLSAMQPETRKRAEACTAAMRELVAIQEELEAIDAALAEMATADLAAAESTARDLLARIEKLPSDDVLVPAHSARRGQLRAELSNRLEELRDAAQAMEADYATARDWLGTLSAAQDEERWADLEQLLANRPRIRNWPDDVLKAATALETQLAEQKVAMAWVARARELVAAAEMDSASLGPAEQHFEARPRPRQWPPSLSQETDELTARLQGVQAEVADHAQAEQWIETVRQAFSTQDWAGAERALAAKPTLKHWPPGIFEEEERYRPVVQEHLQEQERVNLWLLAAEEAAREDSWEKALEILDQPPPLPDRLARQAETEAEKRRKKYAAKLEEVRRQRIAALADAVGQLAAGFIQEVLAGDHERFLRADSLAIAVDAIQWDSPEQPAEGAAKLCLNLPSAEAAPGKPAVTQPFEFRVESGAPTLKTPGPLREELGAKLTRLIQNLQQHGAARLSTPLREGLFPKAKLSVTLSELAERVPATVQLLGPKASAAEVETELAWNPADLAWHFVDPAAFVQRAVEIATQASRDLVKPRLLKGSELLRQYSALIDAEVDEPQLPNSTTIPVPLALRGRLNLRAGSKGEKKLFGDFPVVCQQVGNVSLEVDATAAEAALQQLVVQGQNAGRDEVKRDLETRLKAAPAKVKVTAVTKRIKDPVDQVQFLLKSKGGYKQTVAATWSRDGFGFELHDAAEETVANLLQSPPAPPEGPRPAVEKAASPPTPEPVAGLQKPPRRAVAIVAGVAVVGLIAISGAVWFGGGDNGEPGVTDDGEPTVIADATTTAPDLEPAESPPPGEDVSVPTEDTPPSGEDATLPGDITASPADDTTPGTTGPGEEEAAEAAVAGDNENDNGEPEVRLTSAPAVQRIREILSQSTLLEGLADELVPDDAEVDPLSPTLAYVIPGLANPERFATLVPSAGGTEWRLGADVGERIAADREEFETLLQRAPQERLTALVREVAGQELADFVTPEIITVGDITPVWRLAPDGRFWVGAVAVPVRLNAAESFTLTDAVLIARNGVLEIVAESDVSVPDQQAILRRSIRERLGQALREKQSYSVSRWVEEFTAADLPAGAEHTMPTEAGRTLLREARVTVTALGLKARARTADWNPERLRFEPSVDWPGFIQDVAQAVAILRTINEGLANDHWVRRVLPVPRFVETADPTETGLSVSTPAPWVAGEPFDPATAPPGDRIDLTVPLLLPADRLRFEWAAPPYWLLLEKYAGFQATPFLPVRASDSEAAASGGLWEGGDLPPGFEEVRQWGLGAILPRLDFVGRPALELSGDQASIEIPLTVRWAVSDIPQGLDGPTLNDSLTSLVENVQLQCTLRLSRTAAEPVVWSWSADQASVEALRPTASRARHLDRLVREFPARRQLAERLQSRWDGRGTDATAPGVQLTEDEAVAFLRQIWEVKIGPAGETENLEELSSNLQRARRFSQKGGRRSPVFPTVFAEFFCGPEFTYAIAWSAVRGRESAEVREGPFLIRICPTETLRDEGPLGEVLFDPILSSVREASAARFGTDFSGNLGLLIAPDRPMALIEAGLEELTFGAQETNLSDLRRTGLEDERSTWNRLSTLRDPLQDKSCDYGLVETLAPPTSPWVPVRDAEERAVGLAAAEALLTVLRGGGTRP